MSRNKIVLTEDGFLHIPSVTTKRYEVTFGYDGHMNEFFIQFWNNERQDDDPVWSNDWDPDWVPGAHNTPQKVIDLAKNADMAISDSVVTLMVQAMESDKAKFVDERTPEMRRFQEHLGNNIRRAMGLPNEK
jgi:hypothetical protein